MTTKGREDAGKLNADDAAADNQNLLGKGICLGEVWVVKQLVAGDHIWQVQTGNRRTGRDRPGSNENIFSSNDLALV